VLGVGVHDAEAGRVLGRHRRGGDRDVGARGVVVRQHLAVVHRVELVAGEDDDALVRHAAMCGIDWRTASAVPWYHSSDEAVCSAARIVTKPPWNGRRRTSA
jgi:hypothetical protein